ncbi:MAG: deoxyhypusine synthase family protein [Hyphomonadaceae bacterium]
MADAKIDSNRKAELLSSPVEHIDITQFDARPIIDAWGKMSFTSRDAANAAKILNMALEDEKCSTWLIMAGSTGAGGCLHVWRDMVEYNMADAIVATGASIIDMDFLSARLQAPSGQGNPDDNTLCFRSAIDRIYDTLHRRRRLQHVDHTIYAICEALERAPTRREFIYEIGRGSPPATPRRRTADPARLRKGRADLRAGLSDCSAGFGIVSTRSSAAKSFGKPYLTIDSGGDFRELPRSKARRRHHGAVHGRRRRAEELRARHRRLRGNFGPRRCRGAQIRCADHGRRKRQVLATAACSSSTLQEAASWGKVSTRHEQMVFAEATSVATRSSSATRIIAAAGKNAKRGTGRSCSCRLHRPPSPLEEGAGG